MGGWVAAAPGSAEPRARRAPLPQKCPETKDGHFCKENDQAKAESGGQPKIPILKRAGATVYNVKIYNEKVYNVK